MSKFHRDCYVTFEGQEYLVGYHDHGYEPDTNAHSIDWELKEKPAIEYYNSLPLSRQADFDQCVYEQLLERGREESP